MALDPNFEFRKTKLFFMSEKGGLKPNERAHDSTSKVGGKSNSPNQKTAVLQDAPIVFERQYRLYGAVSGVDQRQRFGNYFDFFWRVKHPSDVTVRLEYRQEKLHEHVQAQEITYRNVRGTNKTEFKVIGDDYFDDGRVIRMALPLNRERPNRGGKPLVSMGMNGGGGARLGVFAPDHAVPRRLEAMRLIKNCGPNQLMRDFSMRGQV